jgi:hypothetical protein
VYLDLGVAQLLNQYTYLRSSPEQVEYRLAFHGPLAQLVEQGTLNPKVIGSIPIRPTINETEALA